MTDFYNRLQQTSQRLIKQYGQGTITYNAPGSEGDPFNLPLPGQSYPVDAVQSQGDRKKQYMDGGYIIATDILLAAAPFEVEPTQAGTMTINGDEYQVVFVDSPTVEPSAPVVYFIGCRK